MTFYNLKITYNQKEALECLFRGGIEWTRPDLELSWKELKEQLKKAQKCEDIIDACKPCRKFKEGETVLLECSIISSADYVSNVAVHHLTATPGEAIVVSNKLLSHKD